MSGHQMVDTGEGKVIALVIGCCAAMAMAGILAFTFGLYLIWLGVAALAVVLIVKGLVPLAKFRAETALVRAEARKIKEETRTMRMMRYHNEENLPQGVYFLPADIYGNFAQPIGQDGRPIAFLLPGNSGQSTGANGVNPKILLDFMNKQNQVIEAEYEEIEEPLQIEGPKEAIPFLNQIEAGLTQYGEEESVLGYMLEDGEPLRVPLFKDEGNFVESVFVIGEPGNGKSVIGTYLAALTVNHGGYILCIDPDAAEKQSLSNRLGPLKDFLLCEVADTPEKAARVLKMAANEITRPGDYPAILLVDEFSMIMRHKKMGGEWKEVATLVASEIENWAQRGRKRRRRAVVFGQVSNASRTGGTELRDTCAYFVFNTLKKKAERVLSDALDEDIVDIAPMLDKGCAIVSPAKSSETYIVKFPLPDEKSLQIIADVRREMEEHSQFQDMTEEFHETETEDLKLSRNILEITPEMALKAKSRKVAEMRKSNRSQKDILYSVWGVLPGGSTEYKAARDEYQKIIEVLTVNEERA